MVVLVRGSIALTYYIDQVVMGGSVANTQVTPTHSDQLISQLISHCCPLL